ATPLRAPEHRGPGVASSVLGASMLGETLLMAFREVRRNALRSFLTMLGVVIGVGAVIVLVTLGQGASAKVKSDIAKLGDNLLIWAGGAARRAPGGPGAAAKPFERVDADAIAKEVSGIAALAPAQGSQVLVVNGNQNWRTQVTGTTPEYLTVRGYTIRS